MSEAAKILPRIESYLKDRTVLDLGCGNHKVVPWAVGVDDYSEQSTKSGADLVCRVEDCYGLTHHPFDVVFSSHMLEHVAAPIGETLTRWLAMVKPGGYLILYLPDERHYFYDRGDMTRRNPGHKHYLVPQVFRWHLEQLPGVVIEAIEPDVGDDRYSFLVIARKAL